MAAENLIQVNQYKCTKCGHCVDVCPNGALDHNLAPLEKQALLEKTSTPDADTAARFLRSRRSVRSFQKKHVPRETDRRVWNSVGVLSIPMPSRMGLNSSGWCPGIRLVPADDAFVKSYEGLGSMIPTAPDDQFIRKVCSFAKGLEG